MLLIALAFFLFLHDSAKYTACVREGISLWAVSVLPSIFPFLFLTAILSGLNAFSAFSRRISPFFQRVFNVSGTGGSAFLLSVISGYPVGARTVADCHARGALAQGELFRLACLCSTTGPVFAVGVVGGAMLKNATLGLLLFACHLISVVAVSLLLRIRSPKIDRPPVRPVRQDVPLFDSVYQSIVSVLCVGGSIALFACFSQMACDVMHLSAYPLLEAVVRGLLEMTTGCALLAATPSPLHVSLCCFFVTFGGLCVLLQQLAFLQPVGIKALPFLGVKLLQGVLSAALCFCFCLLVF